MHPSLRRTGRDSSICANDPHRAGELTEAWQLPGLADALGRMNATNSSVWTSKTDVFDPGPIDPDELDATREEARHAIACYVDLLRRSDQQWDSPSKAEQFLQDVVRAIAEMYRSGAAESMWWFAGHISSQIYTIWARQHISPHVDGRRAMRGPVSPSAWRPFAAAIVTAPE